MSEQIADETSSFQGWAVVELMGHRRLAGHVTEENLFGTAFLRLDIPHAGDTVTQFYAPASVYCITPTTEEIARSVAQRNQPEPVSRWELPTVTVHQDDDEEDY